MRLFLLFCSLLWSLMGSAQSAAQAIIPIMELKGVWLPNGNWGGSPLIRIVKNQIRIDMAALRRPTATGFFLDANTIQVHFPDSGTYTGKLQKDNSDKINWSNGMVWVRSKTIFNINGVWKENGHDMYLITTHRVLITIDRTFIALSDATARHVNPSTIQFTCPDTKEVWIGNLIRPNRIRWNNGTEWVKSKTAIAQFAAAIERERDSRD